MTLLPSTEPKVRCTNLDGSPLSALSPKMRGSIRTESGKHVCEITITATTAATSPGWQSFRGLVSLGDIGQLLIGRERRFALVLGDQVFTLFVEDPPAGSTVPFSGPVVISGRFGAPT